MFWAKLGSLLLALVLIWWLWHAYKAKPQLFSRANLSKSFTTMGILALLLIGFIAICIFILRATAS